MAIDSSVFSPVSGGRISTEIVTQIEAAIAEGSLREGAKLPSERELASIFGVSRITVRDALREMEAVGLIDIRVGATGGAFVQTPSPDVLSRTFEHMVMLSNIDPDEVAEARLAVELNVVVLAVKRATPEDIVSLRRVTTKARAGLEDGTYDPSLARKFHVELARSAHNRALEAVVASFRGNFSMAEIRSREPDELAHARTLEEHDLIVDSIAARDSDGATAALVRHFSRSTNLERSAKDLLAVRPLD